MAMNVMQKDGEKGSLRGKIKRAGWDEAYLARLLTLFLKCESACKPDKSSFHPPPSRQLQAQRGRDENSGCNGLKIFAWS